MHDIIIIGSGISGLYCAHHSKNKNILILEKSKCPGGRIYTVKYDTFTFEAGAGRFNSHHKLLLSLIKKLRLQSKILKIPGDISFSATSESPYNGKSPFDIIDPVLLSAKKMSKTILQQQTFFDFAYSLLSKSDSQFLKDSFGYYEQLMSMNAYDALKLFDKGMHSKNEFYTLKGGLNQIIERMVENKEIMYNKDVYRIEYSDNLFYIYVKNRKFPFICKTCICAIPKIAMEKISIFKPCKHIFRSVGIKILCRMYAIFDKKDIWFKDLPKTTTNNEIRYIIPIDRENGLIMISYTDSIFAKYWEKVPQKKLIERLQEKLKASLNIDIPNPKYLKAFYWETGTAYWKPLCDSEVLSREMIQPIKNMPLYTCGENFSQTQGWIEGALETSSEVLKSINNV